MIIVRTEFICGIVHSCDAAVAIGCCGFDCIAFARIERKEISHINGGVFVQISHTRCSGKGQLLHGNEDGIVVGRVLFLSRFTACLHRQHIGNEQNILHRGGLIGIGIGCLVDPSDFHIGNIAGVGIGGSDCHTLFRLGALINGHGVTDCQVAVVNKAACAVGDGIHSRAAAVKSSDRHAECLDPFAVLGGIADGGCRDGFNFLSEMPVQHRIARFHGEVVFPHGRRFAVKVQTVILQYHLISAALCPSVCGWRNGVGAIVIVPDAADNSDRITVWAAHFLLRADQLDFVRQIGLGRIAFDDDLKVRPCVRRSGVSRCFHALDCIVVHHLCVKGQIFAERITVGNGLVIAFIIIPADEGFPRYRRRGKIGKGKCRSCLCKGRSRSIGQIQRDGMSCAARTVSTRAAARGTAAGGIAAAIRLALIFLLGCLTRFTPHDAGC